MVKNKTNTSMRKQKRTYNNNMYMNTREKNLGITTVQVTLTQKGSCVTE